MTLRKKQTNFWMHNINPVTGFEQSTKKDNYSLKRNEEKRKKNINKKRRELYLIK